MDKTFEVDPFFAGHYVIPDGVTEIPKNVFLCCFDLKGVTVPDSIIEIPDLAFSTNHKLKKIVLPETIKRIGFSAFQGCRELRNLKLPTSLVSIEDKAFCGCECLFELIIPQNVSQIGYSAFAGTSLHKFQVAKGNKHYVAKGGVLFTKGLKSLISFPRYDRRTIYKVPDQTEIIDDSVFCNCANLTSIYFPEGIKYFGYHIFNGCSNLREMHFSTKVPNDIDISFLDGEVPDCTLFVPRGSVKLYKSHPQFSKFKHIQSEK